MKQEQYSSYNQPYFLWLAFAIFILMSGISGKVHAQSNPDIDDLFDMDLEELTVSVASKRDEKISDAPSVISVVTQDEMYRYGARNLLDVLNRVPSLQYINALFFRNNVVSVRGQSAQHLSNRILYLINGRPFRDSLTGGLNMPLLMGIPLENISRLEVIRGPGSVLYGSNAFSSVINIVTKEGSKKGHAYGNATYGSYAYRNVEAGVSKKSDDWNIMLSAKGFDQKGWRNSLTNERNISGSYRQDDTGYGVMGIASYKGFKINSFLSKIDQKGLSIVFPVNENSVERIFIDGGYVHNIFGDWEAALNITFNRTNFVEDRFSSDVITELTLSGEVLEGLNFLFGGSYEDQKGRASGAGTEYKRQVYSAYFQMDYKATDWLKLVAGGQYNAPGDTMDDFSPRFAAVANFDQDWGLKVMYGEAFRAAYAVESFIIIPGVLLGNPSLTPEKIATTEIQLSYNTPKLEGTLTAYHSKVSDIIARIPTGLGNSSTYENQGDMSFRGIELEGKATLGGGWAVQGSATLQTQSDDHDEGHEDEHDVGTHTFSPNFIMKVGISYVSQRGYSFGIFEGFYGNPTPVRDINPDVLVVNPAVTNYHLLTANIILDLTRLLDLNTRIPLSLTIYGDNLFNEAIYYPEYNRTHINSFPSYAGRTVYGTLKITF